MEYIFYSIRDLFYFALLIEFVCVVLVAWGLCHEDRLIELEDRFIAAFARALKGLGGKIRSLMIAVIRSTFIFFYRPYRRFKRRLLIRLLRQFGFSVVKTEKECEREVLSGK